MVEFRWYQKEAVDSVWEYFKNNTGNPLIAMPTGTGKSLVLGEFAKQAVQAYPSTKIICATHVKELVGQNYAQINRLWPQSPSGIYSAGLGKRDTRSNIIFGGIASMAKRAEEFGRVDLMIIDEAHLVSPNANTMYNKFINDLKETNPYLKVIGLTATPYRLGSGMLTDGPLFTDTCYDITDMLSFNRLIAEGYLAPLIPKPTETVLNTDGVSLSGGDYVLGQLQHSVDKEVITRAAIQEAMEYAGSRHSWLVFGSGVEHCVHIAEILEEYGVRAVAIHSKMTNDERDAAIAGFKFGYYQAAVSNNILTTGFDHAPVDLILCLRPTMSPVLWVQMLGRGTRPYDPSINAVANFDYVKENCLVLDFARNVEVLGPINDPVVPKKKGKGNGNAPVKLCDECHTYQHASVRFCTGIHQDGRKCDHEFTFNLNIGFEASTSELIKGDLPIVQDFSVDHISYSRHKKQGKPDSMKVSYYCGVKVFNEFVCLDHDGGIAYRARKWVNERFLYPNPPETIDDLLNRANQLKVCTHLKVWVNQKYPTIMNHCFDGTCFGKQEPNGVLPTSEVEAPKVKIELDTSFVVTEDDIPF